MSNKHIRGVSSSGSIKTEAWLSPYRHKMEAQNVLKISTHSTVASYGPLAKEINDSSASGRRDLA